MKRVIQIGNRVGGDMVGGDLLRPPKDYDDSCPGCGAPGEGQDCQYCGRADLLAAGMGRPVDAPLVGALLTLLGAALLVALVLL